MKITRALSIVLIFGLSVTSVKAQDAVDEISELRQLLMTMQADYDARISDLEERLARAERQARSAERDAEEAIELAEQTAIDQSAGSSAPNTFNPAIGAILVGGYADVDNGWDQVPGFQPAGEIGTGESGFSVGEVELNLKANVDAKYFGNITVAVAEEDGEVEVEFEEGWVQTTDLPAGMSVLGGRFFSEAGYLNDFHFHADDFVDRPLPYQAFYGGRYTVDGLQARWVAPTTLLVELGGEVDWGIPRPARGPCFPILAATLATAIAGNSDFHGFAPMQSSAPPRTRMNRLPATAISRSSILSGSGPPAVTRFGRISSFRANISAAPRPACLPDYLTTGTRPAGTCRACGSLRQRGAWVYDMI
jgi:hypothetical protein